ncbi:myosin [Salix suchowensis]|nr:myosin [Salix suchowensis]
MAACGGRRRCQKRAGLCWNSSLLLLLALSPELEKKLDLMVVTVSFRGWTSTAEMVAWWLVGNGWSVGVQIKATTSLTKKLGYDPSNGHRFILVAINYFTKYVESESFAHVTQKVLKKFVEMNQSPNGYHHKTSETLLLKNRKYMSALGGLELVWSLNFEKIQFGPWMVSELGFQTRSYHSVFLCFFLVFLEAVHDGVRNCYTIVNDGKTITLCWCLGAGFHYVTLLSDLFWLSGIRSHSWLWTKIKKARKAKDALKILTGLQLPVEWLVVQINKSFEVGELITGRSISILDIYGFESFKNNSFEQFCINYANERLQQHFNRHLFKLKQQEYEEDGIDWAKVDFQDNQECLNLFEKVFKQLLLSMSCTCIFRVLLGIKFPNATDLTFAIKLKQYLNGNPCFKGERGRAFGVCHYAGEVVYDTNGFLEKNRDPIHSDFIQLLSSCGCQVLKLASPSSQFGGLELSMQSVGTKFKSQLFKLMHQLEKTTPHFIRCIKPNGKQLPGRYEDDLVSQQFRCCGVLEVVRISRSGYPTRMTHQEFAGRYGFLLMDTNVSRDPLSLSVAVLKKFNVLPEMYQVGYTKVYLRMGQIGTLEELRKQFLRGIVGVQRYFRGGQARRNFHELKQGVMILQSFVRGENIRRKFIHIKNKCTASAPKVVDQQLVAAVYLQSVIRGWLARKQFNNMHKMKQLTHENSNSKRKPGKKISEVKVIPQEQIDIQTSILAELQKRVVKAEATIGQKEEENAALQEQLQQYEKRWSDYEGKMKAMEEMWQMQMLSLQTSLAAARKSLAADNNTAAQPEKLDSSTSPHYYDSEDNVSTECRTPGGNTPNIFANAFPDLRAGRENNGPVNVVNNLAKEFELQKQCFDDEAKTLVEVRAGQSASNMNSDEELRRLKLKFEMWKKDYKVRLRETKARLHKLGHGEADRNRRKWWRR